MLACLSRIINLVSNKLTGSIPDAISALSALVYLGTYNNSLSGTIPSTVSVMSRLVVINLSNNSLNVRP
jgi:hypothetical protein